MVKLQSTPGQSGPSSSLGIVRFFDVDTGGPKLSPQLALGAVIAFTLLIIAIRTFLI